MNALIIFAAIIAGGFLGMVAGFGLYLNREKIGGCEECGKGCEITNYYFYGGDYELEISDTEGSGGEPENNNVSGIPGKHEGSE